jgi:hypothetical protein
MEKVMRGIKPYQNCWDLLNYLSMFPALLWQSFSVWDPSVSAVMNMDVILALS